MFSKIKSSLFSPFGAPSLRVVGAAAVVWLVAAACETSSSGSSSPAEPQPAEQKTRHEASETEATSRESGEPSDSEASETTRSSEGDGSPSAGEANGDDSAGAAAAVKDVARVLQAALGTGKGENLGSVLAKDASIELSIETRIVGGRNIEPVVDTRRLDGAEFRAWVDGLYERYDRVVGLPPEGGERDRYCDATCCRGEVSQKPDDSELVLKRVCRKSSGDAGDATLSSVEFVTGVEIPVPDAVKAVVDAVRSPNGERWLVVGFLGTHTSRPALRRVPERDIWLYVPRTKELRRLTTGELAEDPAWAPDGERFAYSGADDLVVQEIDGGTRTVIREAELPADPQGEYDYYAYSSPDWRPKGRYLAFEGTNGGVIESYVYDMRNDCVVMKTTGARFRWMEDGGVRRVQAGDDTGPTAASAEDLAVEGCPDIDKGNDGDGGAGERP